MPDSENLRLLLCEMGNHIRRALAETRMAADEASAVAHETAADTIYAIDRISEQAISEWFDSQWPSEEPVQVIMEGLEDDDPLTFPRGTPVDHTRWRCIIDPIDGTRGIMYDKRSAWALAGLAPQRGDATRLSDITIAAMTELPVSKQWRADQYSAVIGAGLVGTAIDVLRGTSHAIEPRPSRATDFRHGFASFSKFFPEGRVLTSQVEARLWDELHGLGSSKTPVVFDDQYISTGGQFHELLVGHDRLIADLRPLLLAHAGLETSLTCHPYDCAAWPVLREAGIVFEDLDGNFPDAPLDTTSPVGWIAYANTTLANLARPAIQRAIREVLGK